MALFASMVRGPQRVCDAFAVGSRAKLGNALQANQILNGERLRDLPIRSGKDESGKNRSGKQRQSKQSIGDHLILQNILTVL